MPRRICPSLYVCLWGAVLCSRVLGAPATDTALVAEKIVGLGARDDSLPYEQQPYTWLWERREQVTPALIAGLQSTNAESARGCLRILADVRGTPALEEALLTIGRDPRHPLHVDATLALCRFAGDPRVARLLEAGSTNALAFPNLPQRARLAEAIGQRREAAELLGIALATNKEPWECIEIIQRLATNGTPAALPPLRRAATGNHWRVAAEARLAMSTADPRNHGLTPSQEEFLRKAGLVFKEDRERHAARCRELAALPLGEIRPLLRHMLETDQAAEAVMVCGLARDAEALPEIRRRALSERDWRAGPFIAAWLLLDGSDKPIAELVDKVRNPENELWQEDILRGVANADLPPARQLDFFRAVRDQLKTSQVVARALAAAGQPAVVAALFEEESDLPALATYARHATAAPKPEYKKPLRRAVGIVTNLPPADLHASAGSVAAILDAAAAQSLHGLDASADRLLDAPEPEVATAAARLAVDGAQRGKALNLLNGALGSPEENVRRKAADLLLRVPCANEPERRQRELAILALRGNAAEDYALRVLITCAGPQTIAKLAPRLDGTNVAAARYAAWVLAQVSEPDMARKALRRLALHALFCHQTYQQGAGIDFEVAPGVAFHQTTQRLNPGAYPDTARSRVIIPSDLMLPKQLDAAEQTFLVGDYRELLASRHQYLMGEYFSMFQGLTPAQPADSSYIPLFEAAAREDPELHALYVRGKKVAHFPHRQEAAQNLARLTGKRAVYLGLAGEALAHDEPPPQPYPDQDLLVARFILDRIQAAGLKGEPASDRDWSRVGYFNDLISHLTDELEFGAGLKEAFVQEAGRQQMAQTLQKAGLSLWR